MDGISEKLKSMKQKNKALKYSNDGLSTTLTVQMKQNLAWKTVGVGAIAAIVLCLVIIAVLLSRK